MYCLVTEFNCCKYYNGLGGCNYEDEDPNHCEYASLFAEQKKKNKNINRLVSEDVMYKYDIEKEFLFTEDGQKMFLQIRDHVGRLLREAGAVRMQEAIMKTTGCSWHMLACVDRMVELGELREITGSDVAGQHRVFTR